MKNNIKKDQGCDRATRDNLEEDHQKGKAGNERGTDRKERRERERETGGVEGGGKEAWGRNWVARNEFYYMTWPTWHGSGAPCLTVRSHRRRPGCHDSPILCLSLKPLDHRTVPIVLVFFSFTHSVRANHFSKHYIFRTLTKRNRVDCPSVSDRANLS